MQFHFNGFRPGDPDISAPDPRHLVQGAGARFPANVDVLIVGCGPAGLTLAAQLAAFPDITTRIVEQKPGPLQLGQADGVACRTVEMFHAFGFSERLLKEAYWVNETTFWKPATDAPDRIVRSGRIQDVEEGLSEFPHVILNQARVQDYYLQVMANAPTRLVPDYGMRLVDLKLDPAEQGSGEDADHPTHPVAVRLEHLGADRSAEIVTVNARYVVGCEGARSTVRGCLNRELRGDSANQAWGVMDVLATTDFPDIRFKAVVQSANEGSLLIIPREGGYLVRIYVELDKLRSDERVANRNITIDYVIAAAQRILRPYVLEVKDVAWWSVYEIGQRLCDKFDDVPEAEADRRHPRVFIAGDACHTHSPKAGQGMNVSMQDSFNLGWKLAAVLRGQCGPALLHTYSAERQGVAKELIEFDREFAKLFSEPPKSVNGGKPDLNQLTKFQDYFIKQGRYTAGTQTRYRQSMICAEPKYQHLAEALTIGMRFHSAPVIRLADAKPLHLGHTVKADGRWRLFAFCGRENPGDVSAPIASLCDFLDRSPHSPVRKHTPEGVDVDSVIDVRAVFQQNHRTLALETMPPFLLPAKGRFGLRDYEKMFCADDRAGRDIFDLRGIDRSRGCLVIVRPDQYVAHVLPLDAVDELARFFSGFMTHR